MLEVTSELTDTGAVRDTRLGTAAVTGTDSDTGIVVGTGSGTARNCWQWILYVMAMLPALALMTDVLLFARLYRSAVSYTHLTLPTKRIV